MGRLQDSFKAYITDDADAIASDLATGKIAYGPAGRLVGTATPTAQWDDASSVNDTLLLNFNGTDGSTTFTDSKGLNTFTAFGNAQLDTALKKFGTASLLLDGTGDYTTCAYNTSYFDWWVGDFTLDCWVYASAWTDWSYNSSGLIPILVGNKNPTGINNYWSFGPVSDGSLMFYYFNGASIRVTSSPGALPTAQWVHLALIHDGGLIYLTADGVILQTAAVSGTPQSSATYPFNIGAGNNTYLTGQVDAMRVTYGTARYSPPAGFTAPTTEPT